MRAHSLSSDLFAPPMLQLVDDAQGGIRYWPRFIDAALAKRWFDELQRDAAWSSLQRPMYDRIVAVPRLLARYRLDALPAGLPLADMLSRVQQHVPAPYGSVGLNLYRSGHDSVAMHGDKLHTLGARHPITLVSLGASRRMLIRNLQEPHATLSVELEPGSLLSMSHASQRTHQHGIPKTRERIGPRISAVFRVPPSD